MVRSCYQLGTLQNKSRAMNKSKHRNCPVCSENYIKHLHLVNQIEIVRCSNCKMVYADVAIKHIEDKNIYNKELFHKYIASEPIYTLAYYDSILQKIKKHFGTNQLKVLELGCGPGFFLRRAKLKGFDATGCDFSPYAQIAKETFDLNIVVSTIFDASFSKEEFDVVITHATHEHLGNMYEISARLNELLKKRGLFIVSGVPNYNTPAIRLFKSFYRNMPPSHVNFFEKRSLSIFFKNLEIRPVKIKSYGMGVWAWTLMQWGKSKVRGKKKAPSQITNPDKQIIDDVKIGQKHMLVAKIYEYLCLPKMGRNLEIWGVKQ